MMDSAEIDMETMMGGMSTAAPGDDLASLPTFARQITNIVRETSGPQPQQTTSGSTQLNQQAPAGTLMPPSPFSQDRKVRPTNNNGDPSDPSESMMDSSEGHQQPGAYSVPTRAVGSRPAWHRRITSRFRSRTSSHRRDSSSRRGSLRRGSLQRDMTQRLGAHIAAPFRSSPSQRNITSSSRRRRSRRQSRRSSQSQIPPELRTMQTTDDSGALDSTTVPSEMRHSAQEDPPAEESAPDADCRLYGLDEEEPDGDVRIGMAIIVCISLVIIGVVVGVFAALSGNKDSGEALVGPPTVAPTVYEEPSELITRSDALKSRLQHLSTNPIVLDDTSSPQSFALRWLANADSADLDENEENTDYQSRLEARYALAVLYFSTTGASWNDQMQFLSSNHECEWKSLTVPGNGVTCNEKKQITGLTIVGRNNLRGPLPEEIKALAPTIEEVRITFQTNGVSSNLPSLTKPDVFGELTNLRILDLSNNHLDSTFPRSYNQLSNHLEELILADNSFLGTLPLVGVNNFQSLKKLHLQNNKLEGNLERPILPFLVIEEFLVPGNARLSLSLEGSNLWRHTNLRVLDLADVVVRDTIPETITGLTNLEIFSLRKCGIDMSFPTFLGQLSSLVSLDLGRNFLQGSIPVSSLAGIQNLTALSLDFNELTDGIPEDIDLLSNLVELDLSSNDFAGTIPAVIGNLNALTSLSMNRANLEGPLPSTIGQLSSLNRLEVSSNQLDGMIPADLASLADLAFLDLSFNNFSGDVDFLCEESLSLQSQGNDLLSCGCCGGN